MTNMNMNMSRRNDELADGEKERTIPLKQIGMTKRAIFGLSPKLRRSDMLLRFPSIEIIMHLLSQRYSSGLAL